MLPNDYYFPLTAEWHASYRYHSICFPSFWRLLSVYRSWFYRWRTKQNLWNWFERKNSFPHTMMRQHMTVFIPSLPRMIPHLSVFLSMLQYTWPPKLWGKITQQIFRSRTSGTRKTQTEPEVFLVSVCLCVNVLFPAMTSQHSMCPAHWLRGSRLSAWQIHCNSPPSKSACTDVRQLQSTVPTEF